MARMAAGTEYMAMISNKTNDYEIDMIFQFMQKYATREAGPMLMRYRGKVVNKPKDTARSAGADQEEGGLALTVVDEMIQDEFLRQLSEFYFARKIRINCEEDTATRDLFRGNVGELCTVHQDPC